MAQKTKYEFPYRTKLDEHVQEGVWVDGFGELIHVRKSKNNPNDFEYRGQSDSDYIGLRSYATCLFLRLKDPKQATTFLETLAQTPAKCKEPLRRPTPYDAEIFEEFAKLPPPTDAELLTTVHRPINENPCA